MAPSICFLKCLVSTNPRHQAGSLKMAIFYNKLGVSQVFLLICKNYCSGSSEKASVFVIFKLSTGLVTIQYGIFLQATDWKKL